MRIQLPCCIYENDYNIYGYIGRYEMARIMSDPSKIPHYQGNSSTIKNPNTYQVLFSNSTGYLTRNFWNSDHSFNLVNSTADTRGELSSDLACGGFAMMAANNNFSMSNEMLSTLSMYESWEVVSSDSIQSWFSSNIQSMQVSDANEAIYRLREKMTNTALISWLADRIKTTTRADVLIPMYSALAGAYLEKSNYTDAIDAYLEIPALVERKAGADYTSAYAIASLCMYYNGNGDAGKTCLDSLLKVFPDDINLKMAWAMIKGNVLSASPKGSRMEVMPDGYELHDAYPNPFNTTTTIAFTLPMDSKVDLRVYDNLGRLVKVLVSDWMQAGTHKLMFDANGLASGVYNYRLVANTTTQTKQMTLIK